MASSQNLTYKHHNQLPDKHSHPLGDKTTYPKPPSNIKLVLSYDGTDFLGWQETYLGPTIEGHLREVLERILQEKIYLQAASRTDRGVHAEGQVVNFFTHKETLDLPLLKRGLNSLLPESIRVIEVNQMELSFHPTLDALGKEYHYCLLLSPEAPPKKRYYAWHLPYFLDIEKMQLAAQYFVGSHNFSSFCNTRKQGDKVDKKCELFQIAFEVKGDEVVIIVKGQKFLYKMVRTIVGTLVEVARGKISPEQIPEILAQKKRKFSGVTAPAHGLTLMKVLYGN
jgi:tRNA pseudouridine38-40 synthase